MELDHSKEIEENLEPEIKDEITTDEVEENTSDEIESNEDVDGDETPNEPQEEVYEANLTYKVMDEEKSMPEYVKAIMNRDNESEIRELFEKADGLGIVKEKLTKQRETFSELESKHTQLNGDFEQLHNFHHQLAIHKENGNLGGVLNMLGFDKQTLINEAVKAYEYEQMNEHERQVYDNQAKAQTENVGLQIRLQQLEEANQERESEAHRANMVNEMTSGKHASTISQYEAITGKNFESIVKQVGHSYYVRTEQQTGRGVVLPVEQAVDMAIQELGLDKVFASPVGQVQEPIAPVMQTQVPQQPQQPAKPASKPIPNLGTGSGKAVVKQQYKTMAELKQAFKAELSAM